VTLIPRGQARGLTWFVPGEDPTLISKHQIFARIVGALGGRAAEEVIFGDAEVRAGAPCVPPVRPPPRAPRPFRLVRARAPELKVPPPGP
jgi:hypothetical protein